MRYRRRRPALWHHGWVKKAAEPKKKPTAPKKAATSKKIAATGKMNAATTKTFGPRADLGAPVDGFFARQPPHLRPILDELRKMVEAAAPEATSSLKWGMPFYSVGKTMMCAMAGFKAHVNLILPGPPGTFADPDGLLEGDGKTGQHLKLRSLDDLPRAAVQRWLARVAAKARNPR